MGVPTRYRLSSLNVINEIIDGEAVIINLDTGSYYSLDKVGARAWSQIERGATAAEIVGSIRQHYEGDAAEIERAVMQLLDEMQRENLIVPSVLTRADGNSEHSPETQADLGGAKLKFEPPVLHKYTDMQELLLLDPIHDVDEAGWPSRKPEAAG